MITHIIPDDKFPDKGIENFQSVSKELNRSLIIADSTNFTYLKNKPDIVINKKKWFLNSVFISTIRTSDALVFHGLSLYSIIACIYARRKTKLLWIGWGYDYYNKFVEKGYTLFGPLTAQLKSENEISEKVSAIQKLKRFVRNCLFKYSLKRIEFFSPVIMEDYKLFLEYFPRSKMKYLPWNYGASLLKMSPAEGFPQIGPNILIGNSASFTNNHLEAFEILQHIDLGDRKIIVPLSYGDPKYRDYIVEVGKKLFGDAFIPLLEFIPVEEYHEILQTCSIAIMNHYRQQAVGNISALIQSGVKVYLSERNPFIKTCKRIGVKVFRIEDLEKDYSSFYQPLTEFEKENNYLHYTEEFNQEKIQQQTKIIIDELLGSDS
jgi:hypothetical protein